MFSTKPTNHLDLWARTSLEKSIRDFNGTVLLVSHDRYFLNQVADHLLVVEPERFRVIEGNYDDYRHFVSVGLAGVTTESDHSSEPAKKKTPPRKNDKPTKRKRKFPYRKVPEIEADIHERESRIEDLHGAIGFARRLARRRLGETAPSGVAGMRNRVGAVNGTLGRGVGIELGAVSFSR